MPSTTTPRSWSPGPSMPAGSDGGSEVLVIQVEELAAGPDLSLEVVRVGAGGGPRVAILGGVHGDELEGVLAAQRLIAELGARPVTGTVTVLARANPPALATGTRLGADSENLARVFPG